MVADSFKTGQLISIQGKSYLIIKIDDSSLIYTLPAVKWTVAFGIDSIDYDWFSSSSVVAESAVLING